ncbi:MAG: hypothetical protein Q9181_005556 [Wetmoreana brouardii]
MSTNHASREGPRAFPTRTSPQHDQDSEKGEQQPRRRIGLAVNSTNILAPTTTIEFPYSMSAAMSRSDNGVGLSYTGGYGSMQPPGILPFSSSSHRNGSMNGHQYPSMASRHSHPSIGNGYSYGSVNDDDFGQYSQTPQYMLPAQDPQASLSPYNAHETSRGWTPMSNAKHTSSTLAFEHDPAFKYGPSHFSHMNSSAIASVGADDALFPPMNSMARHLPQHGSRILPSPRKTSLDPSSNSYQKAGESASYGLQPALSHRSSAAWSPQTLTAHGGSQGSVSSTSLSSQSGPMSSVSSSPPMDCNHTTTFGYQMSNSPIHPELSVSRASDLKPTVHGPEIRHSIGNNRYANGHTKLPIHASPKSYRHSVGYGTRSDATTDTGKLINGGLYQHIREKLVKYNPGDPLPTERPPPMIPTQKEATAATASRQG